MEIPVAKRYGLTVITNGSAANRDRVLALGADRFIDYKTESITQGSCAKMFTIAGPVIVYGVSTSVIYGIILVSLQSF